MSEQENIQHTRDIYAAFGRGDVAAIMQALTDDIDWVIPGPSELPHAGTRHGKQAVQEWFGVFAQTVEYHRFEPYDFIAQGDKVVALIHVEGTMRHSHGTLAMDEANVLTFRDGKLARFQTFEDTAANMTAFR